MYMQKIKIFINIYIHVVFYSSPTMGLDGDGPSDAGGLTASDAGGSTGSDDNGAILGRRRCKNDVFGGRDTVTHKGLRERTGEREWI